MAIVREGQRAGATQATLVPRNVKMMVVAPGSKNLQQQIETNVSAPGSASAQQ